MSNQNVDLETKYFALVGYMGREVSYLSLKDGRLTPLNHPDIDDDKIFNRVHSFRDLEELRGFAKARADAAENARADAAENARKRKTLMYG